MHFRVLRLEKWKLHSSKDNTFNSWTFQGKSFQITLHISLPWGSTNFEQHARQFCLTNSNVRLCLHIPHLCELQGQRSSAFWSAAKVSWSTCDFWRLHYPTSARAPLPPSASHIGFPQWICFEPRIFQIKNHYLGFIAPSDLQGCFFSSKIYASCYYIMQQLISVCLSEISCCIISTSAAVGTTSNSRR